jgi:gliding motility-associated-like protein
MKKYVFLIFFLFNLLLVSRAQCNLNVSICQQNALAGPFGFAPASNNPSTCLDFINGQNANNYAYIVLYITQGGVLNLLINGNNTGPGAGCLDVSIFNITNLSNPCAQLSPIHEIGCNYVFPCDGCAEFGFAIGGCPAQIPAPFVQTGDVIMILVEDWSNTQNSFSLSLGNTPNSAQTGPPNATINPVAPVCSSAAPFQLTAANMGGTWSGPGVSASGIFNPAAAGIGAHTISYSLGAPPCNSSSTTTISVINCDFCAFDFIQTDVSACNGSSNTFNITGFVEFVNPPSSGTLTISDCNGNSQIFTPPFVSPINYALNNILAGTTNNCAVTATFSANPSCTITGLPFNYPAPCNCPADAGTFTTTVVGSSNLLNPFNLCFNDQLNIVSNGDFVPPNPSQNNIIYDPGLWLLVYECPPTIFPQVEINDDPCLLGVASDNNGAWTKINDIGDGETFYFVPITMYSMVENYYTSTNSLIHCYDMGPVYPVTYLPPVVATQTSNCAAGTVTATISGGSAAVYGSVFTAQNLQPATASFLNTTASNNGTITVAGLTNGQSYSFDVIDENGCFVTVSGVFQGAAPVQIQYPHASYCLGQPNPIPSITGQGGGVFTASPAGLVINSSTGLIDLATSSPGVYTITYSVGPAACPSVATTTLTISNPVTPTFAQVGPFCTGSNIPALPTTSQNNISGTWSPAINNQQTTTYTFTPNPNQCAVTTTMTIEIDQPSELSIVGLNCAPGPFNWVSWNTITSNSAIGSIGTNNVTVNFTTGGMFQTAGVFSGNIFPVQFNLPINSTSLAGQNAGEMTFCFDQPVLNPQVAIASLGNGGASVPISTSVPYNIVWAGQGMNYLNSQSLVGTEGYNIIEFQGTHTCITINFLAPEFYWNIVFGGQTQNCPIDPICEGQSITLVAQGSNNVSWSPLTNLTPISNTQVQVSPLVTTTYTITENNACQSQATVEVQVIPNVLPIFPVFEAYCAGANIPELPNTSLNNITGVWSPAINNQQTTIYTFTPDNTFCSLPTTAVIEIGVTTTSTSSIARCENELPFEWNGLIINDSGQYQFNSTGQNGCDSLAILNFTVINTMSSNSSVTICESDLPFLWNGQLFHTSGQYSVLLTGSNGCDSIANLILTLESTPLPIFNASQVSGCSPLSVSFQNNTIGQFSNCVWNFGNGQTTSGCNQVSSTYTSAGCYDVSLTLTSSSGCVGTSTLADLVCVTETPLASFVANPTVASSTDPTIQFVNSSINASSYTWNFGDDSGNSNEESPSHSYPEEQGSYEVTLIAFNGSCSDTVSQLIVIESEPLFYVPNTFTPDGDLVNNTFLPVFSAGFDPYDYKILIFNRWGEILFESNNAKIGWDGTYGGILCQDGVYIWQIVFTELGRDRRQLIRGHVNLLR